MRTGNATAGRTITKRDAVERIAEKTGLRKTDVKLVLQQFLDGVIDDLGEGNRLEFRDFGVFEVCERKARTAQNPKTLEPVTVPAKFAVKFKPGRRMKEALDGTSGTNLSGGGQSDGGDSNGDGNTDGSSAPGRDGSPTAPVSPASVSPGAIEPKPGVEALAGSRNGQA